MALQKYPKHFLWNIILCSTCTEKLWAVAIVHFHDKNTICTCLSLQSVFLYYLQSHSQWEYTIVVLHTLATHLEFFKYTNYQQDNNNNIIIHM